MSQWCRYRTKQAEIVPEVDIGIRPKLACVRPRDFPIVDVMTRMTGTAEKAICIALYKRL